MNTQNFGLTSGPDMGMEKDYDSFSLRDVFTTEEGRAHRKEKKDLKKEARRVEIEQKRAMTDFINAEVSGSNQPSEGGSSTAALVIGGILVIGLVIGIVAVVRNKNKASDAPTGENTPITVDEVMV